MEQAGYLTGAELRAHACRNLKARAATLGALLTTKYAELVVDEAQDCSAADLHILSRLHDAGGAGILFGTGLPDLPIKGGPAALVIVAAPGLEAHCSRAAGSLFVRRLRQW